MKVKARFVTMFPGYRAGKTIIPILLICILVEVLLIQFTPHGDLTIVKSLLGWIGLFFIPGFLVLMVIFKGKLYLGEIVPISLALGLVTFTLMGFLAYAVKASIGALLVGVLLEIVVLLVVLMRTPVKTVIQFKDLRFWVLLAVALCFSGIFIRAGAIQAGDAYTHLAWIRRLTERGVADPSAFGILPKGPVYPEYVYDTWHLAIAFISRLTRMNPIAVWVNLPILLIPFFITAFWALARQLFHSTQIAFFTALFYIFFAGVYQGAWTWWLSPYPDQIGKFLLVVALTLFLKFVEKNDQKLFVLTAIAAASMLLVHVQSFFYFTLLSLSYIILYMLIPNEKKHASNGLKILVAATLLSIPILIPKLLFFLGAPPSYNLRYHSLPLAYWANTRGLIALPLNSFINSYKLLLAPIRIASLISLPFLAFQALRKRETWAIVLLSGILGVAFIAFNPIAMTLLSKINVVLVTRMGYPLDLFGIFIVSSFIYKGLQFIKMKKAWLHEVIGVTFLLFASIGIIVAGGQLPRFLRPPRSLTNIIHINKLNGGMFAQIDEIAWVGEDTEKGSTILTDSATATGLVAPFFDRYVIPFGTACTPMGTYPEIYYDAQKVLDPEYDVTKVFPVLTRYNVKYVLTRSSYLTRDTDVLYQYRPCELNVEDPLILEKIDRRDGYTLYKVKTCSLRKLTHYYLTKAEEEIDQIDLLGSFKDVSIASRLAPEDLVIEQKRASVVGLVLQQVVNDIKENNLDSAYKVLQSTAQLVPNNQEVQKLFKTLYYKYFEEAKQAQADARLGNAFVYVRKALLVDPGSIEAKTLLERIQQKILGTGEMKLIALNNVPGNNGSLTERMVYSSDRAPDYWSPKGDELLDGGWNSPATCVAWYLYGDTVTISVDLLREYPLQNVSVISNFFTDGYGSGGMNVRLFVGRDEEHFVPVDNTRRPIPSGESLRLGQGVHYWKFDTYESARYIRIVITGYGLIPVGEISIKAYRMMNAK